ncbi:MAG: type III pantothenate kinase [Bacteroidales bacterium]
MNLIIDIGNTSTKVALAEGGGIVRKERLAKAEPALIEKFAGRYSLEGIIVSSVGSDPASLLDFLRGKCDRVHNLTWQSEYPFSIDYGTPETLGVDRLAAAAGGLVHHRGADLLVIDAGSALTVDLVSDGAYRGGSISPGLSMRFRALHEYTDRLPLVTRSAGFSFPGQTTEEAIAAGVVMGMVYEINEYIRTFEEKHEKLITVITGGDSELLSSRTDKKLFIYPDLVTEGLNFLLDTNV